MENNEAYFLGTFTTLQRSGPRIISWKLSWKSIEVTQFILKKKVCLK